jgi:hypothetical protein
MSKTPLQYAKTWHSQHPDAEQAVVVVLALMPVGKGGRAGVASKQCVAFITGDQVALQRNKRDGTRNGLCQHCGNLFANLCLRKYWFKVSAIRYQYADLCPTCASQYASATTEAPIIIPFSAIQIETHPEIVKFPLIEIYSSPLAVLIDARQSQVVITARYPHSAAGLNLFGVFPLDDDELQVLDWGCAIGGWFNYKLGKHAFSTDDYPLVERLVEWQLYQRAGDKICITEKGKYFLSVEGIKLQALATLEPGECEKLPHTCAVNSERADAPKGG